MHSHSHLQLDEHFGTMPPIFLYLTNHMTPPAEAPAASNQRDYHKFTTELFQI